MTNNIELVLTDLDGTVVLPNLVFNDAVRSAIIKVEQQGVAVTAVTGREYSDIKPTLAKLGIKGLGIFMGGAAIIDIATDEVVWSKKIDEQLVSQILVILKPHTTAIDWGSGLTKVADIETDVSYGGCLSIWAAAAKDEAPLIIERLNELPNIVAHGNPGPNGDFSQWGIQVTNIDADKYHGVHALLAILGTPKDKVLAIGDGDNDIPLFNAARVKVAMGNAADKLKDQADYIVSDIDNDGFAEAMVKYVLT